MRTIPSLFTTALLIIFSASLLRAQQAPPQPTPMPNTYVHDFAGVIRPEKRAEIQAKARRLKDEFKTEIALVTIDSLNGENSFDYSMRMARSWGIGSPDNEIRGLLILVAVRDRKTAFRTSRHVEGELTDGTTGQISRHMNNYFKTGDFGGGLSAGMDKILEIMKERYEPSQSSPVVSAPQKNPSYPNPFEVSGTLLILLVGVPFAALGLGLLGMIFRSARGGPVESYIDSSGDDEEPPRRRRTRRGAESLHGGHRRASYAPASTLPEPVIYNASPAEASRESDDSTSRGSSSSGSDPDFSLPDFSTPSSDYGSSTTIDNGSTYSGGSDFGGGGTDTSW